MYFSTSQNGNRRLAELTKDSARQFGAHLIGEDRAHIPFESVVAAIARGGKLAPELAARQLVAHDPAYRAKAFRVGVEEFMRAFGGEDKALQFYRNASSGLAALRFESTGGLMDDVAALRNRLAARAVKAYWAREKDPTIGLIPQEREYVDLLKSVRQTLETAMGAGRVGPDVAEKVIAEVQGASTNAGLFGLKEMIQPLQTLAREELYHEQAARVLQRYMGGPSAGGPAPEL